MPDAVFIVATEKKGESLPSGDSILMPTGEFSVNAMRFTAERPDPGAHWNGR